MIVGSPASLNMGSVDEVLCVYFQTHALVLLQSADVEIEFSVISDAAQVQHLRGRFLIRTPPTLLDQHVRNLRLAIINSQISEIGTREFPDVWVNDDVVLAVR